MLDARTQGLGHRLGKALTFPQCRRALAELLFEHRPASSLPLRVLGWWAASLLVLAVYANLRGKMDDIGMPVHGSGWENAAFGSLPTLWLQHHVWPLAPKPLEWASVVVHASWFFVPPLAAIFVTWRRPHRVGSFFRWWIALELTVLALFALLPMRPPWMADPGVTRIIAIRYGGHIGDSNPLAAMPSLHVAFPAMIALWFLRERWTAPAFAMLGYAALIALEVVFSGEHYVVDVIGAFAVAAIIALAARVDFAAALARLSSLSLRRRAQSGRLKPALERVRAERGQALIEFAFVLPIIFVFVLVLFDFGLALDRREVIQHGVREGARYGAVGHSVSEIVQRAVDQSDGALQPGDITVCYVDGADANTYPGDAGDSVRVSANYTYKFTVGGGEMLTAFGVGVPSIDMTPSAEARLEATVTGATACP